MCIRLGHMLESWEKRTYDEREQKKEGIRKKRIQKQKYRDKNKYMTASLKHEYDWTGKILH